MKKINLKSITEPLSEYAMKEIVGGLMSGVTNCSTTCTGTGKTIEITECNGTCTAVDGISVTCTGPTTTLTKNCSQS